MKALSEFTIGKQHEFFHATGELTALLSAIKLGAKIIHHDINKAGLVDILGTSGVGNVQSEVQQKLDLFANEKLKAALKVRDIVTGVASGGGDEAIIFEGCGHAKYVVLMDPLDGLSNIDASVSVGTIFSIYRRITPVGTPVTEEDFLQSGNKQAAVGYMVYGSSTMLIYTTGCGIHAFTCNSPLGIFCLCQEQICFPEKGKTRSVNGGNYTKFPNGAKKYIRFYQEEDKSTNRPHTSRYIGSLIADFRRNLLKDGIYLYPSTTSHPDGKLHLLYEYNPMASLAEQVSGKASDDKERTLDIIPETLHQRHSFFIGNDRIVEGVRRFIREFPDA